MPRGRPLDVAAELLEAFEKSARVTEYLIGRVPDELWHAPAPSGRGRSLAAIAAHLLSVRRMFARMGGARPTGPSLDRRTVTRAQAVTALRESADGLVRAFAEAIDQGRPRVSGQPRRLVEMLMYLIQHDAHHRGQITMRVADLGGKLAPDDIARVWGWKKLP
jgi:uncharacterized damage-inducible protein DinB